MGTKSLLLQARNRINILKHMPTNKTNKSVMQTSTTQTSLGKCTVSPGTHIASIVVSERTLRKAVHVDGGSEKIDLRLPAPLDKHAVEHTSA